MKDSEIVYNILHKGETRLFAMVVKKYGDMIFSKSLGITKRKDVAREITQQTLVRAYSRLSDFRGQELGAWLIAIACHLSLNHLEKEKRERGNFDCNRLEIIDEEGYEERENAILQMEEAICSLSADDQKIIRLHYYDSMKTEDVAKSVGLSQSNVLVRLHRIRERLRKQLTLQKTE